MVKREDSTHVASIVAETYQDLTPLDVAGRHHSFESALLLLKFFEMNFDIILDVFHGKSVPG